MKRKPIDLIVYFDTNIYNHLFDDSVAFHKIKSAVDKRIIRIFISVANVEELLGEYVSDKVKTQQKFNLTREICMTSRVAQDHSELINAEFNHLLDPSIRINVSSNNKSLKEKFFGWWELLSNNIDVKKEEITKIVDEIRKDKDGFRGSMKEAQQKMRTFIKQDNITSRTIPEFIDEMMNKGSYIDSFIASVLGDKIKNTMITVDMVKNNLSIMEGFRHLLYYNLLCIIYHHDFAGGKPEPGDSRDMYHAIYAGYADIFVSNDGDLIKYLQYIPTDKHRYLKLDEFVQVLSELDIIK